MEKKEIALSFLCLASSGKLQEAFEKYIHQEFRHHNPNFQGDSQSLKKGMNENAERFPKKIFVVQRVLEDKDLVAVHSRIQLKPDFPEIAVIHIFRFQDEHIVELWDVGQQVPRNLQIRTGCFDRNQNYRFFIFLD